MPKLTSLTTEEDSRSFEFPRIITLEGASNHSSSSTDIPSLTTVTLEYYYVFANKKTVHTNSSSSSSPSFLDITPALQHYLSFPLSFTHNSSSIPKRTHNPSNKPVFETRIRTSNTIKHPIQKKRAINNKQTQQYTNYQHPSFPLLQRNELRRVSSTNTRAVVLHRLVSQRELTQVVTDHLSLDFNVVEVAAVVHTHHGTNHLRNHDHVTQMSLHGSRALVLRSVRLLHTQFPPFNTNSLAQSLDQSLRLSLQTAAESATSTSLHTH